MARRNPFYSRFADFAAFHGLWDDLTNFAQEVIPDKTIVGKVIDGDLSGAAKDAANYFNVGAPTAAKPVVQPGQTGMFGNMPTWLPIVGIGIVALMVLKKKR